MGKDLVADDVRCHAWGKRCQSRTQGLDFWNNPLKGPSQNSTRTISGPSEGGDPVTWVAVLDPVSEASCCFVMLPHWESNLTPFVPGEQSQDHNQTIKTQRKGRWSFQVRTYSGAVKSVPEIRRRCHVMWYASSFCLCLNRLLSLGISDVARVSELLATLANDEDGCRHLI